MRSKALRRESSDCDDLYSRFTERFGLVHVVPDNVADEFRAAYTAGEFPECLVYRETVGNAVFLVTELQDLGTRTAIAVAARYDAERAEGMIRSVVAESVIKTWRIRSFISTLAPSWH